MHFVPIQFTVISEKDAPEGVFKNYYTYCIHVAHKRDDRHFAVPAVWNAPLSSRFASLPATHPLDDAMKRRLPASLCQKKSPPAFNPMYIWIDIKENTWKCDNAAKAFLKSNPNLRDGNGVSVLEHAVRNDDADLVEYLVNETAVNTRAKCSTPTELTDLAVMNAQRDVLALLLYGDAPSDVVRLTELNFTYNVEAGLCNEMQEIIDRGGF